ncbi:MAG TPA: hypothetical protein VIF57_18750 [Polyangia bacterium]|jgi:hypothetical protein
MRRSLPIALLALAGGLGCDAGTTKLIGEDFCSMAPDVPPAALGVGAFYAKYLDASGVPVLSSAAVDNQAVVAACKIVVHMLSLREDVRRRMVRLDMSVAIIGAGEKTTDIPEYRNLYTMYPNTSDWDNLRGIGATKVIPVSSVGEENLICLANDVFAGEALLVQTFATGVQLAVEDVDNTFESRLNAAYQAARTTGLWANTYASQNDIEYYAEGVQSWFDANKYVAMPDGNNGPISTRGELQAYDPALASLIGETMRADKWRPPVCP